MSKISVIINTFNEEKNIEQAIKSAKFANEIVVCDMHSDDKTVVLAKKFGAKVVYHKKMEYVEPARNFAVSQASGDWILVLDADEEIPESLSKRLKQFAEKMTGIDYVELPRKNNIFNKWMKASMWWPDYNIRFFKKGSVRWSNEIHKRPEALGLGLKLDPVEEYAIVHHHYESVTQFVERLNRYTKIQSKELVKEGYTFSWIDLLTKPTGEFLSRFFANRGFEDGLHGLSLSLLQAFSHLVMYLKVWEINRFPKKDINMRDLKEVCGKLDYEIDYWFKNVNLSENPFKRFFQKVKNKIS